MYLKVWIDEEDLLKELELEKIRSGRTKREIVKKALRAYLRYRQRYNKRRREAEFRKKYGEPV